MNRYPLWKYALLVLCVVVGFIYAIPNVFMEDPAVQVSAPKQQPIPSEVVDKIESALAAQKLVVKKTTWSDKDLVLLFDSTDAQLKAKNEISRVVGSEYTTALNLVSSTPSWLSALGAEPMKLGLDLRGGVHFLLEVDIDSVVARREEGLLKNIAKELRSNQLRYLRMMRLSDNKGISVAFKSLELRDKAYMAVKTSYPELLLTKSSTNNRFTLVASLSQAGLKDIRQSTLEQTMTTLRNRVNELGVAEAVVHQQGANRIAVDLPGIQDATRAKEILGGTATIEFKLVDHDHEVREAINGIVPVGSSLYDYHGRPILLKNQVVLSGDSITNAQAALDETGEPEVQIQLGGGGESTFYRVTRENINKQLAIVFVETKTDVVVKDGETVKTRRKVERVISNATINSALGSRFRITGLDAHDAKNLSLYLRAGALPAAIDIVEERTVGPTLGLENIKRGMVSLLVGLLITILFMALYYRVFGVIADIALVINLILLVALLSLIGTTLTVPGIASIVLTLGMAIDANVLIFERIREELRSGSSPQAAIFAGYDRAFATIVDANLTTLIVAVVLFTIGTGPIQGFAITLILGLLTSMLSGVAISRAMVNGWYGYRQTKKLSIGISN